jgi:uncharacterized membrane protein YfcA
MLLAPFGTSMGQQIPAPVLLSVFAVVMGFVGWRMWRRRPDMVIVPGPCVTEGGAKLGPSCYARLGAAGAAAGVLSGLFGIGGGFIIVPVLIYVTGMSIHRAVATSLLVIFLIALTAVASSALHGLRFPMPLSAFFVGGGFAGMLLGSGCRSRFSGKTLQNIFAVGMWLLAAYMIVRNGASLVRP